MNIKNINRNEEIEMVNQLDVPIPLVLLRWIGLLINHVDYMQSSVDVKLKKFIFSNDSEGEKLGKFDFTNSDEPFIILYVRTIAKTTVELFESRAVHPSRNMSAIAHYITMRTIAHEIEHAYSWTVDPEVYTDIFHKRPANLEYSANEWEDKQVEFLFSQYDVELTKNDLWFWPKFFKEFSTNINLLRFQSELNDNEIIQKYAGQTYSSFRQVMLEVYHDDSTMIDSLPLTDIYLVVPQITPPVQIAQPPTPKVEAKPPAPPTIAMPPAPPIMTAPPPPPTQPPLPPKEGKLMEDFNDEVYISDMAEEVAMAEAMAEAEAENAGRTYQPQAEKPAQLMPKPAPVNFGPTTTTTTTMQAYVNSMIAIYLEIVAFAVQKCGFNKGNYQYPAIVAEGANISHIPGFERVERIDCVDALGKWHAFERVYGGVIKGHTMLNGTLPVFTLYVRHLNGRLYKRKIMAQNPNKTDNSGKLKWTAELVRDGQPMFWIINEGEFTPGQPFKKVQGEYIAKIVNGQYTKLDKK